MTPAMILWPIGVILALIVTGFGIQIALESWSERQEQPTNYALDFEKLPHFTKPRTTASVSRDMEDTGVIRIPDMSRLNAKYDADIGQEFVDRLKQRLILAGEYS